jgi:hypothetical protein
VYNYLKEAPIPMNINRTPTFDWYKEELKVITPDIKEYDKLVKELEELTKKLQMQEAAKPKRKCGNMYCMNDDQCQGCGDELTQLVSGLAGVAGKAAGIFVKGMIGGALRI